MDNQKKFSDCATTQPVNITNNKIKNNYSHPIGPSYLFELYISNKDPRQSLSSSDDIKHFERVFQKEMSKSWCQLIKPSDRITINDIKYYRITVTRINDCDIITTSEGTIDIGRSYTTTNNNIFIEFTNNSNKYITCSCFYINNNSIVSPPY
jgi:hypothetical protein